MMTDIGRITREWRWYLHFCLAALEDLCVSFRVFDSITKGLMGMALQRQALSIDEAKRVETALRTLSNLHAAIEQLDDGQIVAKWMVDLELALTDPNAAQGSSLVDGFEKLMMEAAADM